MSELTVLKHLARNHAFANERLHAAVAELTHDDYVATRTSFFPSLHLTLQHNLLVDLYYLDALEKGGRGRSVFDDVEPLATHAAVRAAQHATDVRILAFVDALGGDDALARTVTIERAAGVDTERVGDVLVHMLTHAIHHRGQAHAMLSGTFVKPPQLDEYFLQSEDRARAERELEAAGFAVRDAR